jgi:hypothetical protein
MRSFTATAAGFEDVGIFQSGAILPPCNVVSRTASAHLSNQSYWAAENSKQYCNLMCVLHFNAPFSIDLFDQAEM